MAKQSKEVRGFKNIVRGALEELDGPNAIPPVINNDGSFVSPEELSEVAAAIKGARKSVGLDG